MFRLPTALQLGPDSALLFFEGGVRIITLLNLEEGTPYSVLESGDDPAGRIWALVDTHSTLKRPSPVFDEGPFFVVQASSPRPGHCNWAKKVSHLKFYMEPWSFAEVIQV